MSNDFIGKRFSTEEPFDGSVLDETIGLGKSREETDRFAAAATEEAPDEDEQGTKAHPTQVSAVVA